MKNRIINKDKFFSESGLSFVELIVVIVFISIALASLLNVFSVSLTSSVGSEHLSLSVQLAEYKMEQVRSDKASFGYNYLRASNYPTENSPENYSGYTRSVLITTYSDYKKVEVSITKEGINDVSLVALFTNY